MKQNEFKVFDTWYMIREHLQKTEEKMSEIIVNSLQPNSISIMGSSCSLTHSL